MCKNKGKVFIMEAPQQELPLVQYLYDPLHLSEASKSSLTWENK